MTAPAGTLDLTLPGDAVLRLQAGGNDPWLAAARVVDARPGDITALAGTFATAGASMDRGVDPRRAAQQVIGAAFTEVAGWLAARDQQAATMLDKVRTAGVTAVAAITAYGDVIRRAVGVFADQGFADPVTGTPAPPPTGGVDPATLGLPPGAGYAADPVNTGTGNFVEVEADLAFAGPGCASTIPKGGTLAIGYAPNIPNGAWENAARDGIPIARDPDELIAIIRELE